MKQAKRREVGFLSNWSMCLLPKGGSHSPALASYHYGVILAQLHRSLHFASKVKSLGFLAKSLAFLYLFMTRASIFWAKINV